MRRGLVGLVGLAGLVGNDADCGRRSTDPPHPTDPAHLTGGVDINAGTTGLSHVVSGPANGTMYSFTVRTTNAVRPSPASAPLNSVLVALVTDHPLQQGSPVKAVHIVELRQRIDAQRVRFGLSASS